MRVYIEDIARHDGQPVSIHGWLANRRSSGKLHFLQLRDGSGFIQAVMSKAAVGDDVFRTADHLSQETSIVVHGTVRQDSRAPGGYELDVTGFEVVGTVRNLADGRVELVAEGERGELEDFLAAVKDSGLRRFIVSVELNWEEPDGKFRGFEIVA